MPKRTVLTEEQKDDIRFSGEKYADLANRYHVSSATIGNLRRDARGYQRMPYEKRGLRYDIPLSGGGRMFILCAHPDAFALTSREREFVFSILDMCRDYLKVVEAEDGREEA